MKLLYMKHINKHPTDNSHVLLYIHCKSLYIDNGNITSTLGHILSVISYSTGIGIYIQLRE